MKLSIQNLQSLRRRLAFPLETLLTISWWTIVAVFLVLLFLDGLLFFLYGLGRAEMPAITNLTGSALVQEDVIRAAAGAIETNRAAFQSATSVPSDFLNPFR